MGEQDGRVERPGEPPHSCKLSPKSTWDGSEASPLPSLRAPRSAATVSRQHGHPSLTQEPSKSNRRKEKGPTESPRQRKMPDFARSPGLQRATAAPWWKLCTCWDPGVDLSWPNHHSSSSQGLPVGPASLSAVHLFASADACFKSDFSKQCFYMRLIIQVF